jgi:spermidine/putrescine transport system ATP-binding protein
VGFGLKMAGMARTDREQRTREMLAVVQLEGMEARMPSQLSGGQQQRVALARAMATEPEVVLLDEPLGALDLKLRREMQVELKRIQQSRGLTFIYVTHDQEEALSMSDRLCVMHGGRAMQTGTPREIYRRPASRFVAEFMGENNVLPDGAGKWIAVRPEDIHCGVTAKTEHVRAEGTVQECVYQGAGFLLHLRLSDGHTLRVHRASSDGALEPGSTVDVWWPQGAEHVLTS